MTRKDPEYEDPGSQVEKKFQEESDRSNVSDGSSVATES